MNLPALNPARCALFALVIAALAVAGRAPALAQDGAGVTRVQFPGYEMQIDHAGFRVSFKRGEKVVAPAHATSGLLIGPADGQATGASVTKAAKLGANHYRLDVTTAAGVVAVVDLWAADGYVKLAVRPESDGKYKFKFRTGPVESPAFGLADHAAARITSTELTGFETANLRSGNGPLMRQVSNFVIFPKARFAQMNFEPGEKIVRVTKDEVAQGTASGREMPAMYYFFGEPSQIYKSFQYARNAEGYKVYLPKPEFFGVGWEAFGALGWKTNHETVSENVQQYLDAGYPLKWMVVGSGFWPNEEKRFLATTSFGLWDKTRYPDPRGFVKHFKDKGLKFFIGLRISFITDGPYSAEGVEKGYFLKDEAGKAKVYNISFPKSPCYLLDAHNPDALNWYVGLCQKWVDYGIDGFKEDLFGYGKYPELRDDKIDPTNEASTLR